MNSYQLTLDSSDAIPVFTENFIQENKWFYLQNEKELFIFSIDELSEEDIQSLLSKKAKCKINSDSLLSVSLTEALQKVKEVDLKLVQSLHSLMLVKENSEKEERKEKFLAELNQTIGLNEFKKVAKELLFTKFYKEKLEQPSSKDNHVLIFYGNPGSGRSYASDLISKWFDMEAKHSPSLEYYVEKIIESDSLIIHDFDKKSPYRQDQILSRIQLQDKERLTIFIETNKDVVEKLSEKISELNREPKLIAFPDYEMEELCSILNFLLKEVGIIVARKDLIKLIQNEPSKFNSYDIVNLAQDMITFHSLQQEYPESTFSLSRYLKFYKTKSKNLKHSDKGKINEMIGLVDVKSQINELVALSMFNKRREELGLKRVNEQRHLVFTGNPGTGKTVIARLLAKSLYENSLIQENKLIEVGRAELIAEYVGQTAPKVKKVFERAKGGILFIDEAYSLADNSPRSYAREAVITILQEMENKRDQVLVILAGYQEDMEKLLDMNQGFYSRISRIIHFPDYDESELFEIFQLFQKKVSLKLEQSGEMVLRSHLRDLVRKDDFGNGRYIRTLFETIIKKQASRLSKQVDIRKTSIEALSLITKHDVEEGILEITDSNHVETPQIGFRK